MKYLLYALLCVSHLLCATDKLRVYDELNPASPVYVISTHQEIANALRPINIRFEQWQASQTLPAQAEQQDIIQAYQADVERLQSEGGYTTVDVVRMLPDNANKDALRQKFLKEHTHSSDEVRFFVEGAGLFYIHVAGKVYLVLCEQGDLISIPAGYAHWFDMGDAPYFTAIRFFTDNSGWIPEWTGSDLAQRFPEYSTAS